MSGLLDAWDEAVAGRDRARMIEILVAAELTAEQASGTADAVIGHPGTAR